MHTDIYKTAHYLISLHGESVLKAIEKEKAKYEAMDAPKQAAILSNIHGAAQQLLSLMEVQRRGKPN